MSKISIKKDDNKQGWLYLGMPVDELKTKYDLLRFITDETYYDNNIESLIETILDEAKDQTDFKYDEASLFGFVEGHTWIHCRVLEPTETNVIHNFFSGKGNN